MQLKSVQETNPNHPPAWIASARLKEVTGIILLIIVFSSKPSVESRLFHLGKLQAVRSLIFARL